MFAKKNLELFLRRLETRFLFYNVLTQIIIIQKRISLFFILFIYSIGKKTPKKRKENLREVMAKVLDCNLEVSEFKLQSRYYVHFWTKYS